MRQYFVFIMLFLSVYLVLAEVNLQEKINNNGEAQFTADKAEIYSYNNLKFDVPKDAKVDYKDGLIVVTVPERSTIKKPGLIDPGKYAGVNLKYVSENGKPMLIEDGNKKFSLEGTVENKAVQKLEVFFDGKENAWYFSKARINGMVVGLTGETSNKDIYIFSDGDKHRDFGHAYFSYNGDKKISFGVPAGHKGMYVILREGNPIVPITNGQTALRAFGADAKWPVGVTRQSHISIENRDTLSNPPLVSTEGPFMIKNGNLYYAYEPYLNPEVPQFWNLDDHQQSAYLEIASRNHEGKIIEYTILDSGKQISKTLTKNLYMNNDNGAVFLDPADVSKNKNLIKLASLTQPERAIISTLMTLPPDKQQQILGSDVNGFLGQDIEKIRKKIQAVDLKQITGAGTSTPPQTPQTPIQPQKPQQPQKYGGWESQNIKGYQVSQEGFFYADVGTYNNKKLVQYVTKEKLLEVSKNKGVRVRISEPSHCSNCRETIKKNVYYMTSKQAEEILRWKGGSIPDTVIVKDGRIIK